MNRLLLTAVHPRTLSLHSDEAALHARTMFPKEEDATASSDSGGAGSVEDDGERQNTEEEVWTGLKSTVCWLSS